MAALSAVVLIPLGIAATSFALTDRPASPKVPSEVVLESDSPTSAPVVTPEPTPTPTPTPDTTPTDEVVSRPPVTDSPTNDDDDDDHGQGAGSGGSDDDGPDDNN
jgi:hypothetical protein